MRRFALSLVFLATTSAHADVILYQTSFDTDTTDVPGMYSPFEFNAPGYEPDKPAGVTYATDATTSVQSGVLHISRASTSHTGAGFARPELTLSSQDLSGESSFPSVFTVSLEMGGTPGAPSWWSNYLKVDDQIHADINYGFNPGYGGSNFHLGIDPQHTTTAATGAFFPAFDLLVPVEVTVSDLENGSYQFDLSVTDPQTSLVYQDSKVLVYPYPIRRMGFGRSGPGGGDAIFDNLTISSPVPEPSTGLLLATGILGLALRRRTH